MVRNLKDAFYNAQFRVGQGIFTRAVSQGDNSLTESNFTANDTFDTLIEDDTGALPEFVDSQISMSDAASNGVAMNKISASQTAMDAVAASQTAMNAVAASQTAMNAVAASQTAMNAVAASQTAMDAVAASQTAMDAVAASQTAMNAVAASQTAMNAVAASQTARDVIGFSGLAYDTIAASNMAIGKYAIGYTTESPSDYADMDAVAASQTAMDAVAASQTAMDAVAASQTAMDAVAASQTASQAVFASVMSRTKTLSSQYVLGSIWSNTVGSEEFWRANTFTNFPNSTDTEYPVTGDVYATTYTIDVNQVDGRTSLEITSPVGAESTSDDFPVTLFEVEIDFTDVGTLEAETILESPEGSTNNGLSIIIDGTTVFNNSSEHTSWTQRSLDVSSYSGTLVLKLEADEFWDFRTNRVGFRDITLL